MTSFRAVANRVFKNLNLLELTVCKYYHGQDVVRVEVKSPVTGVATFYDDDWVRHVNLIKYNEGRKHGVWVRTFEGYHSEAMVQVSREFYTK